MNQAQIISKIIAVLEQPAIPMTAVVGFDGYIDQIKKVVYSRSPEAVVFFDTISSFSERIAVAAGKSAQLEMVVQTTKLGGNAPIMANALAKLGFSTTCIGTLGQPTIHPLFEAIPAKLISLGKPADTTALEFKDGKLILSDLTTFEQFNFKHLQSIVGQKNIVSTFKQANLIAMVGLSNLYHANDLLSGIAEQIIPISAQNRPHFFIDLADPSRKSEKELKDLLDIISSLSKYGKITLGLNENETIQINQILTSASSKDTSLEEMATSIYSQLKITQLLVHPVDCAIMVTNEGCNFQKGRLVKNPTVLTGAGDNLNAGFCLANTLGLNSDACLILGMANSGAYITLGYSPNRMKLIHYLETWKEELGKIFE